MAAAASTGAARGSRRGGTPKLWSTPYTSYDPNTGKTRHRRLSQAEADHHAEVLDRKNRRNRNAAPIDPDSIDHPQVRAALLDRWQRESSTSRPRRAAGRLGRAGARAGQVIGSAAPASVNVPGAGTVTQADASGWLLGLFFYASVVNPWLGGGWSEVKQWWAAKFLNHTLSNGYLNKSPSQKKLFSHPHLGKLFPDVPKGGSATQGPNKDKTTGRAPVLAPPPSSSSGTTPPWEQTGPSS